ncbi:Oligopeptide transport system permease protein OppB [Dirofilaria immitis]
MNENGTNEKDSMYCKALKGCSLSIIANICRITWCKQLLKIESCSLKYARRSSVLFRWSLDPKILPAYSHW